MINRSLSAPLALHERQQSSRQTLELLLPSYLTLLFGTRKRLGKHTSRTLLPNALGPGSSRLRLCHSGSLCPPRCWFRVQYTVRSPSFSPQARRCATGSRGLLGWPSQRCDGARAGEEVVPAVGCFVSILCRLALKWPRLKIGPSACHWSELSAYCSAATPRMPFSYWYTLLTPSVEGTCRVSKSAPATATFWLALGKVGCGVPSWLMVAATALARAQALV
jgi:hypothetical protein